jgi:hypothetical protein
MSTDRHQGDPAPPRAGFGGLQAKSSAALSANARVPSGTSTSSTATTAP